MNTCGSLGDQADLANDYFFDFSYEPTFYGSRIIDSADVPVMNHKHYLVR
jgi:hypothetical protein